MKEYITPKGKEITTYPIDRNIGIMFKSGGELPEELSGIFTDKRNAEIAIQKYLGKKSKDA